MTHQKKPSGNLKPTMESTMQLCDDDTASVSHCLDKINRFPRNDHVVCFSEVISLTNEVFNTIFKLRHRSCMK